MSNIEKSTRHTDLCGKYGVAIVLCELSKKGIDCGTFDQVGIDAIAKHPMSNEKWGISVKTRTRTGGKNDYTYLSIENDNFEKMDNICKKFDCKPYISIVIDTPEKNYIFLLTKEHYLELSPMKKACSTWKMSDKAIKQYKNDPNIKMIIYENKDFSRWF